GDAFSLVLHPRELDEQRGATVHRGRIDIAVERDGYARLDVEAIQDVDEPDVVAVRHAHAAVRQRHVHAQAGQLRVIGDREYVGREDPVVGRIHAGQHV